MGQRHLCCRCLFIASSNLALTGMDVNIWGAFIDGLLLVLQWPTFGYMLLGLIIGFFVGILPGLGGAVTLALLLPFTFSMSPPEAFAFLLGMLAVGGTTGDITSILFGVPGEGSSSALVVDGHAMAKKGQAGRALGAALMSSLVGAVIGAFVLAAAVPIIRPVVLSFGSPEFFMLALLGISFVASVSGTAVIKGLIAGGIGIMIAMVGLDPQMGTQRYTFGQLYLWDGIGLIPVALGLFAIPELVDLARKGTSIAGGGAIASTGGVLEGVKDTFKHWSLTLRTSILGAVVGMIPGLGGSVAQWIAYGHAVQTSKTPETFGKGNIEGVLGPGAANNSKEAGNLIPAIAFGLPATVSMALLLGAFQIHGMQPGPKMLTEHLPITMSFVWVIVITNIITVAICLLFLRQIAMLTRVRGGIIIPIIMLLVVIGVFAEKNQLADIGVLLAAGVLGVVMVELGWPRPPLILGLVLGKMTENYLFLSVAIYDWGWVTRPIVLVLGALCIIVVVSPFVRSSLARRKNSDPTRQGPAR